MMSWESQAPQYPRTGPPGISYFRGQVTDDYHVDCLLYRDHVGELIGILNRYPADFPPYESAGAINVWVDPEHRRQGIGSELMYENLRRWRPVQGSKVTETGMEWLRGITEKHSGTEIDFREEGWEAWHARLIEQGELEEPFDR